MSEIDSEWTEEEAAVQRDCWSHGYLLTGEDLANEVERRRDSRTAAALLLDRAESYQRDAGVIRQALGHDEAVAYETIAAELRRVAEEVGRG